MALKKVSPMETNREVRRVFARHSVDTSKLQISCHGRIIMLTGGLYKLNGDDLDTKLIEVVMQELARIGIPVQCDLENWTVSGGSIAKKGEKKEAAKNNEKKAEAAAPQKPSK